MSIVVDGKVKLTYEDYLRLPDYVLREGKYFLDGTYADVIALSALPDVSVDLQKVW